MNRREEVQEDFEKLDAIAMAKISEPRKPDGRTTTMKNAPSRFKPGVSGNPKGKPKGTLSLVSMLKKRLMKIDPKDKKRYAEKFIDALILNAITEGKEQTQKTIMSYVDGMPDQKIDMDFAISKIVINDPTKPLLDNPNADATVNIESHAQTVSSLPSTTQS
jgi:hypothetical protein